MGIYTYSHVAPALYRHVAASQHAVSTPPVSHCSPDSTMPLPHCCNVVTVLDPGACRHCVNAEMPPQIVDTLHGLNSLDDALLVGFIKYSPPASHCVSLYGQQLHERPEHGQDIAVQS